MLFVPGFALLGSELAGVGCRSRAERLALPELGGPPMPGGSEWELCGGETDAPRDVACGRADKWFGGFGALVAVSRGSIRSACAACCGYCVRVESTTAARGWDTSGGWLMGCG